METAITVLPAASPDNCLASVLASWLPADDDAPPRVTDELAVASLSVLLNVAAKHSAKLLNRRRPLVNEALKSTTNEDAKWLPCLPIGGVRYFVGSASNKFLAVPIQMLTDNADSGVESNFNSTDLAPRILKWKTTPKTPPFYTAASNSWHLLESDTKEELWESATLGTWIADSFEKLVAVDSRGIECPPHLYNLLTNSSSENEAIQGVLGHTVDTEELSGQSFAKSAINGLIAMPVPLNGSRFWRAGVAIADYLELMDEVACNPLKSIVRASPPAEFSPEHWEHRWAMEKLIRFSLQRLCGRTANASLVQVTGAIPPSLKRVLDRLRKFPAFNNGLSLIHI